MIDPRIRLTAVCEILHRQLYDAVELHDAVWKDYWEGRRMVTVPEVAPSILDTPEHRANMIERDREFSRRIDAMKSYEPVSRPFPSFPNLAPNIVERIDPDRDWRPAVRTCIARLKAARDKDSTNRNLSTLLAVVVKVQKDLETLVGDDWKKDDAAVESQVTRDDRS